MKAINANIILLLAIGIFNVSWAQEALNKEHEPDNQEIRLQDDINFETVDIFTYQH